jgi:hypothetical protein
MFYPHSRAPLLEACKPTGATPVEAPGEHQPTAREGQAVCLSSRLLLLSQEPSGALEQGVRHRAPGCPGRAPVVARLVEARHAQHPHSALAQVLEPECLQTAHG